MKVVLIRCGLMLAIALSSVGGSLFGAAAQDDAVLPGVPDSIPIDAQVSMDLPAGAYQWQTTNLETGTRSDPPITVHSGFIIALDQTVVVIRAGAGSRSLPPGSVLAVDEGDRILAVSTGTNPGSYILVEFVSVDAPVAGDGPDQTLPVTLPDGTFTIALLNITDIPDDMQPGTLLAEAAGAGFVITTRAEDEVSVVPFVVWLAAIYATGDETQTTPTPDDPPPTVEPEPTEEPTLEPTAEPTLEPTPDKFSDEIESLPDTPSFVPVLPGVPTNVTAEAVIVLPLSAGEYQWQTRNFYTGVRGEHDPMEVHDGFVIATRAPILVLRENDTSIQLEQGQALAVKDGDRILPISVTGNQDVYMLVEFVAAADGLSAEDAHELVPMSLPAGLYSLAVLDIQDAVIAPGQIIAQASGPGFGVAQDPDSGQLTWLVGIFRATESDLINYEAGS